MLEEHLVQPSGHFSQILAAVFGQYPSPQPTSVPSTQLSLPSAAIFLNLPVAQVVHWSAPVQESQPVPQFVQTPLLMYCLAVQELQAYLSVERIFPASQVSHSLAVDLHLVHPEVDGSSVVHFSQTVLPSEYLPAAHASHVLVAAISPNIGLHSVHPALVHVLQLLEHLTQFGPST